MRIIAGKYKRRKLFTPKGIQTRPSTDRLRETLMAILEGGRFGFPLNSNLIIDVFAGTGALGIEAASRGHPNKVIFIEKNSNAVKIIEENIKITKSNELFEILNIDLSQIKKRMALQLSDKQKIKKSHFIINNNLDIQNLKKEYKKIINKLI